MVNGLNGYSNQDIMLQEARRKALAAQQNGYVQQTNESIMPQNQPAKSDNVVGKDDGKIGFWKGLKSFGKGLLNFAGGLIGFDRNGNWSAGRFLKNVVIGAGIAAACVLTAGTAVPAIIAGAGVMSAGAGLVKSQYQFWTAKTDAQAIAAMEDTGSNTAGLGLSLVGAKATMKQVPGVDAAKYDGFMGTLRAGWDSSTIGFSKGLSAITTGYKAYRVGGFQALKTVASENWTGFQNTVVANYKNATKVPTVEENQTNRVKQYDDRITELQEQVAATTDKGAKYSLNKQIKRLQEEKTNIEQAYNQINSETTFANAQNRINTLQKQIETLKHQTESYTNKRVKFLKEHEIAQLEQQMNVYKSVINQKTTQARNIRAEIETLQKVKIKDRTPEQVAKLAKLREQQKDLGFNLPSRKEYEILSKNATESSKKVLETQEKYNQANQEFTAAENAYKKFKEGDTSAERLEAHRTMLDAKDAVNNAYKDMVQAKLENTSNQALQSAASGADYTGAFIPKAGQFFKTFNNLYGKVDVPFVAGKRVPFTQLSVPRTIGKAHTIVATNELVNPSVGGPSLDEMLMQELQNELMAQYQQASQVQQAPTEADYAQYQQMMNEYQATVNEINALRAAQAQAYPQTQAYSQAYPQQTTGQPRNVGMDMQNLDYIMKAYGITA